MLRFILITLFCLATVATAADLRYVQVVDTAKNTYRGWYDPDTAILHMATGRVDYADRGTVVSVTPMKAPPGEPVPTQRVCAPAVVQYGELRSPDGTFMGSGWLVTTSKKYTWNKDDAAGKDPFPLVGDMPMRNSFKPSSIQKVPPAGIVRLAKGMGIQSWDPIKAP